MKISVAQATPLLASFAALSTMVCSAAADNQQQCHGLDPQPDLVNFLGATLDYEVADRICCHNHRFAEYKGYLAAPEVDLFGRLDPDVETIFYDSVCGIPLFIAPRGRTFEEFKEESLHHGWPSFRPEEIVSENVIIHDDGRMESRCLTHLGHNLPYGGVDRYCIDLVCIAGAPLSPEEDEKVEVITEDESVITSDELDADTYVSSAEEFSGKYNDWQRKVVISVVSVASVVVAGMAVYCGMRAWNKKRGQQPATETKGADSNMEDEENSSGTHSSDGMKSVE